MRINKVPSAYSPEQLQQYLERVQWKGEHPKPTLEDLYVSSSDASSCEISRWQKKADGRPIPYTFNTGEDLRDITYLPSHLAILF